MARSDRGGTPAEKGVAIVVDNRITSGGARMQEDRLAARLTTKPIPFCGRAGCDIPRTEKRSGGVYQPVVCQTLGEIVTNGNRGDPADDANPRLVSSRLYYGVRMPDGTLGYVSEVWIQRRYRGGMGLPLCASKRSD